MDGNLHVETRDPPAETHSGDVVKQPKVGFSIATLLPKESVVSLAQRNLAEYQRQTSARLCGPDKG